ncbi:MAG: ATP-dependent DNA helicase [Agathobacter sp.]|nr:ATP-dependent DNA helicase [Agathobacter sp.]
MDGTKKRKFHTSVRNLVEFIFREGDIDNRHGRLQSAEAMQEGSRIHRKIQSEQGENYLAEVPLSVTIDEANYSLVVEGRADGIFTEETEDAEQTFIDEIKGMYANVSMFEQPIYVHKAQAMCYAYIFAKDNLLEHIGIQMTYCNLDDEERKIFREVFSYDELKLWFDNLILSYKRWTDFEYEWRIVRQASIKELQFPYPYRQGQKKLVGDVYRTIARKKNLFIQAPTGVGKTISTVFPAVKAVGEELADRIFYLTAKTITATVAKETFLLLMEHGYKAKMIHLTAKEKLCMCEEMDCNPVHCPYAKGHYDRVNDAVYDLLQKSDCFTREEILAQAELFQVCPFEMSLDVATWADDIICDYNYVFDPNVYLKRFFQEGIRGDYIFLIDEAHNLVERSREMYSARLCKEDFLQIKRLLTPYNRKLVKGLERCNRILLDMKRECDEYEIYDDIGPLLYALTRLASDLDEFLQKPVDIAGRDDVLDFYFEVRNFLDIYDRVDEHYVIYTEIGEDGCFYLKLFCVDPSKNLQECLDKANSAIFFSATLLPINYYKSLLSEREDDYAIYAESTFEQSQRLLLFGRDVSTKYTRRSADEFDRIAQYIYRTIRCRKGNYMVFFPSYKLMEQVQDALTGILQGEQAESIRLIAQKNGMREQEREAFLEEFAAESTDTLVAFCVMGGIFGEGIDLKKDQLIGAVVVGTGLPQVSNERDILKNYYDERNGNGFDYAFRYPGMNKVLQAAGRVIRTSEDRGVILLLDERFLQRDYDALYPREWSDRKICSAQNIEELVLQFWDKQTL